MGRRTLRQKTAVILGAILLLCQIISAQHDHGSGSGHDHKGHGVHTEN